ncbi:hypothetical protein PG5_27670 [Pseudomonas sp. G5(2012)]|jgi:hypothetical protein|nr:hypothetical protein PG5_27670 [Pseudomonas sp. G5(2012)]
MEPVSESGQDALLAQLALANFASVFALSYSSPSSDALEVSSLYRRKA